MNSLPANNNNLQLANMSPHDNQESLAIDTQSSLSKSKSKTKQDLNDLIEVGLFFDLGEYYEYDIMSTLFIHLYERVHDAPFFNLNLSAILTLKKRIQD